MPRYALNDPRLDDAINEMAAGIAQGWPPVTGEQLARLAPLLTPKPIRPNSPLARPERCG